MIGDYFTREERPKAQANHLLGGPVSVIVGYFAAGWLNQLYGWRVMFAILGLPGLALASLSWLTLKEPRATAPGRNIPSVTVAQLPPNLQVVHALAAQIKCQKARRGGITSAEEGR